MKSVKIFGKSVPLLAIVMAGMLIIGASAVLVDYLSNTVTATVTIIAANQPPVAEAGPDQTVYVRSRVYFSGLESQDPEEGSLSYSWDFDVLDGIQEDATGPTPSHVYYSLRTYTVTLTVTDDDGATGSDTMTVTVSKPPSPPPLRPPNKKPKADAGPNVKISVGSTIHFSGADSYDKDGYIISYIWTFHDGTTATGVEVNHTYTEPGHYKVILTIKDNRGTEDSDKCEVFVWKPPAPVADKFGDLVPGEQRGFKLNALDEANTIVTLDTTDQVTVTILKYDDNPHPDDPIPATAIRIYVDVEVSDPDAVVWPIYVEMFYTDEEVEGLNESSLGIYYWKDGAWQTCSYTGVDTEKNIVWAYMTAEEASGSPILIGGTPTPPPPPPPPPPPKPAEFEASNLIVPEEIELGEQIKIIVTVTNVGEEAGNHTVTLNVDDGLIISEKEITLEGGESERVTFEISPWTERTYEVEVDGLTGSFEVKSTPPPPPPPPPPPKPAEFKFSDLEVTPVEVEEGLKVAVTVKASNVGEEEGSHTVELKVDGYVADSQEVTLEGGASVTVLFELERGEGTYQVEVEGMTDSFTVVTLEPPFWMRPGTIVGIIIVIIVAATILYFGWKGKIPSLYPEIDDEI